MKIPVIFHNPRSYDCHFVLQEIGERGNKYTLRTRKKKTNRWNSKEHGEIHGLYMEMPLVFLDSFQFMSLSLDWLASDLPHEAFKYTSEAFKDDKFKLMKKRKVFILTITWAVLQSLMKKIPEKKVSTAFFKINTYLMSSTSMLEVWNTFNLNTMREYHDLHLKSHILLLADVFENFRKTCLSYSKLDPCHYFTSPGLS